MHSNVYGFSPVHRRDSRRAHNRRYDYGRNTSARSDSRSAGNHFCCRSQTNYRKAPPVFLRKACQEAREQSAQAQRRPEAKLRLRDRFRFPRFIVPFRVLVFKQCHTIPPRGLFQHRVIHAAPEVLQLFLREAAFYGSQQQIHGRRVAAVHQIIDILRRKGDSGRQRLADQAGSCLFIQQFLCHLGHFIGRAEEGQLAEPIDLSAVRPVIKLFIICVPVHVSAPPLPVQQAPVSDHISINTRNFTKRILS